MPPTHKERIMNTQNFTAAFTVDQTADEVFAAINDVRGWWSENIDGTTDSLGEEFTLLNLPMHRCTIRIAEHVSGERVVWHVMDNLFSFTEDKTEWKDTDIHFDIARRDDKTELTFAHLGLVPDYECFDICSNAWGFYVNTSLRGLIRTGTGVPNHLEQDTPV